MASRVTQEVVEAVTQADPSARVTQEVVEAVTQANPNARLSALYVEAVCSVDTIYEGEGDIVATASLSASARIVAGHEWQAIGLLIEGVRNPADSTDQNPVLFVQGDLSGGLDIVGAPLAGATVLPWIPLKKDAVGGFGWVADPRKPVGPGAPATVRINDNRDQLGPIFAEDLGVAPPTLWEIRESRLTRTQTAIRVYGPTAPTVGSIVWLNEEAVYLSSVTTATDNFTHDLVVVRARCGSRARAHRLRPKSFPAGEDGKHTRLYLRSRPDFDRERWQATLYLFDVQGNTAVAIRKMKRGYVLSRPRPTGTGYVVTLEDFTKNLHAHRFGGRADVPITHAVQALTVQKSATPSRPGGRGSGLGHVPPAVLEHLLELAVLKPKRYRYRWPSSGDWSRLGRWLENEALLSITMWSDDPLTGACGLRACDRTVPVTPPESLVAVKGQKGILNPGTRLGKVQALRIEVGFQGKDLAYQDFRLFRLKEADTAEELEESNILAIRIWDRGALFAPSAQNAGPIPRVVNYYLRQLRLAPSVYKIPASILRGANRVGGFYKLTDTTLQNANGRGFVELVVLVVGVDTEWTGGAEYLLLLPYALPLFAQTTGKIAPSLRIFAVDELAGAPAGYTDFDLWVTSIGDPGFNVATAYNNFFSSLASSIEPQGGRVRIVSTEAHNPFAGNERRGWLEASARVLAANYDGAHSRLKVRIADEWKRGGDVDLKDDLLVPDRSFVLLGDFRPAAVNVEGVDLVPSTYQRASSPSVVLAAAAYAPPAPTAPYDRYYYLFA
jgi:hypothetical protein